jgi:hypothetical protein
VDALKGAKPSKIQEWPHTKTTPVRDVCAVYIRLKLVVVWDIEEGCNL